MYKPLGVFQRRWGRSLAAALPLLVACGEGLEVEGLPQPPPAEQVLHPADRPIDRPRGLPFALVLDGRLLLHAAPQEDWAEGPVSLAPAATRFGEITLSRAVDPHKLPADLADLPGQRVRIFQQGSALCEATVGALRVYRGFSGLPDLESETLEEALGSERRTTVHEDRDGVWRLTWTGGAQRHQRAATATEVWGWGQEGEVLGAELAFSSGCAGLPAQGAAELTWARGDGLPPAPSGRQEAADPHLADLAVVEQRGLPIYHEHRKEYEAWRQRAAGHAGIDPLPPPARYWEELGEGPVVRQIRLAAPGGTRTLLLATTRANEGEYDGCGDHFEARLWTLWEVQGGGDRPRLVLRGHGDELPEEVEVIDVDGALRLLVPGENGPALLDPGPDGAYETSLQPTHRDYNHVFVCPC